jgi:hypothetical protein
MNSDDQSANLILGATILNGWHWCDFLFREGKKMSGTGSMYNCNFVCMQASCKTTISLCRNRDHALRLLRNLGSFVGWLLFNHSKR